VSDKIAEFCAEQALGAILGRVRLDGALTLPGGARASPTLVWSTSGLWLLAARDRFQGLRIDLSTRTDLHLVRGRFRDQLCFEGEALPIPAGRRSRVERLIALARFALGHAGSHGNRQLKSSRYVAAPDELGSAWLARTLETERRAAIVGWSSVGDVLYVPITAESAQLSQENNQACITAGETAFLSRRANADATREVWQLLALPSERRLLECARRNWLGREHEGGSAAPTFELLHAAIAHGSARARFAQILAGHDAGPKESRGIDELGLERARHSGAVSPAMLAELWAEWQFSAAAGSALVKSLIARGDKRWALALHRRVHTKAAVKYSRSRTARARAPSSKCSPSAGSPAPLRRRQ
jgi:hypothetical protein